MPVSCWMSFFLCGLSHFFFSARPPFGEILVVDRQLHVHYVQITWTRRAEIAALAGPLVDMVCCWRYWYGDQSLVLDLGRRLSEFLPLLIFLVGSVFSFNSSYSDAEYLPSQSQKGQAEVFRHVARWSSAGAQ